MVFKEEIVFFCCDSFMVVSVNVIGIVVGVAENVHSVVGVAEK